MSGLKSRQHSNSLEDQKNFQLMIYENLEVTMLRLFESFMETLHQFVPQIYILTKTSNQEIEWRSDTYLFRN